MSGRAAAPLALVALTAARCAGLFAGLGAGLGAGLAGCLAPEDAPFFAADWERALADADRDAPGLPAAPGPRPADGADWIAVKLDGDGPLELSVEEATVLALRHNRDLAVQQLEPVIVGAFEQIERGVFDPEAFFEIERDDRTTSEVDRGTRQQFSVDSTDRRAVGGVRQALPSGTGVEATVSQDRDTSNRSPEQQQARLGLTVTQQLLRGAGPAVNLVRIRQAELDTQASLDELRGFTEVLLAGVERTYWRYVLALERIAIFEESLAVARRQLDDVEQRIAVGVLPATEAAVARVEVSVREQALIDARSAVEAERLRLLRLISPPPGSSYGPSLARPVTATSRPAVDAPPLTDLDERVRLAERRRPDLAEARVRLERNRLETIMTRNGMLPRLELFIALGKTGFDDTFTGSFEDLDGDTYDFTTGIRFSQILGNDAAGGRDVAAFASRRQAAAAIENLTQLIELDVRLAANEIERTRQQIAASRLTRVLQEDSVRAELERYDVGASTGLLVAQAQRDLLLAQIAEVESVVAYRLALIDLYVAEGSLLDRRGYVVEGEDAR